MLGEELVRRERVNAIREGLRFRLLLVLIVVSIASCERAPQVEVDGENVPSVEARVLTIRVNIPEERAFTTSVIVAGTNLRLGSEADRWRLFSL